MRSIINKKVKYKKENKGFILLNNSYKKEKKSFVSRFKSKINAIFLFSKDYFIQKRRILFSSFVVGFVGTLIVFFLVNSYLGESFKLKKNHKSNAFLSNNSELPELPQDLKTLGVLLLGHGGAGHDGGHLTDAIQLLYLDFDEKKAVLISIPRDLWITEGGQESKINAVLAKGIVENMNKEKTKIAKNVIFNITGLKVNYLIAVDFVGFQRAVGLNLGGVDVEVGKTLDDPWYPITGEELNTCGLTPEEVAQLSEKYSGFELERQFPCRYEHLYFEKGTVYMEGGDALKYVRSRHGSSEGDISRGKRQQEVLAAISKKIFSLQALDDIPGFFSEIIKHVSTDIDLEVVKFIGPFLKSYKDIDVKRINLSTTNVLTQTKSQMGAAILVPREGIGKWGDVQEYIQAEL